MKWFGRKGRPQTQDPPEVQAARWLARESLGLMKREDEEELQRWREDPHHEQELASLRCVLEQTHNAAASPGIGQMRSEALAHTERGPWLLGNVHAGLAAGFVAVLFVGAFLWFEGGRDSAGWHSGGELHETRKGEQRTITLTDGSKLTLNTHSRVQVLLTPKMRRVQLLQGQALFEVAKDSRRPFTVSGGPMEITALGTQFDLRLDGEAARVVLLEGKVKVAPAERRGLARLLPMLDREYLSPGQQLFMNAGQRMSVRQADVEQAGSWRFGRLIFRGESLAEAVAEFNRYTARQLVVNDPSLAALPVHGVFSVEHPDNFLAALATFYPIELRQRSPGLTQLVSRKE